MMNEEVDTTVALKGDLILQVGVKKKRIRVDALVMRNGSPTFNKKLDEKFVDAQLMFTIVNGPMELALPDDNAQAIETICLALHGQMPGHHPDPKALLQVSQTVNKYSMQNSLFFATNFWLENAMQGIVDYEHFNHELGAAPAKQLWYLLLASRYLSMDKAFSTISKNLVLMYRGSFSNLAVENDVADEDDMTLSINVYQLAGKSSAPKH